MYCCPVWFNSISSSAKKLICSYNSVLRAMFVTLGIPSFYELLRKCIYNFSERISSSRNFIINPIRSGGALKASPPPLIVCSHAFNFGAALLCVGDFS